MSNNQLLPMTREEYQRKSENEEIPDGAIVQIVENNEKEVLEMVERLLWECKG